jgi:hypothetical protein
MRRFLGNLVLVVVATAVALGAVEAYLRWANVFDVGDVQQECNVLSDNPKLLYELKPGCGEVNSAGIRDGREYTVEKRKFRIEIIGDSIAYARGIPPPQTFARQLERRVAQDRELAPVEVINLGVEGYSTVQEVETLRTKGLRYQPDLVIVQYFLNDETIYTTIFDMLLQDLRHRRLDGFVDALDQDRPAWQRWLSTTRIAIAVRFALARLQQDEVPPPPIELTQADWDQVNQNRITEYYRDKDTVSLGYSELKALAQEHGFPVVVAVFPVYYDDVTLYSGERRDQHSKAMRRCKQFGFHCIDMFAAFEEDPRFQKMGGLDFFHDLCCHLGPKGHAAAGEILYRALKQWKLLPPRTTGAAGS